MNPILDFIDSKIHTNELGQPFRLVPHQREVLAVAFDFDADGILPWDTIVFSCVKKSARARSTPP